MDEESRKAWSEKSSLKPVFLFRTLAGVAFEAVQRFHLAWALRESLRSLGRDWR